MCSPSSSADRDVSIGSEGESSSSHANLPGAEQFILHHSALLGPCAQWFTRTLWAQAAQHAYQDSLQLLDFAQRYTPQRLEHACQCAMLYHLESLAALRFIFAEDLDRLPLRPDAELTGQLLFPFANP